MTRILFVCLGNICRSPLAEAIFNKKIDEKGLLRSFYAESCGTANYHVGSPPDPRTTENAAENGVTITHVGRQISTSDLEKFDLIIPMDRSNLSSIMRLDNAADRAEKIHLMREFDSVATGADVPDPYYGTSRDFQQVFEILDRSMEGLISFLTND